MAQATNPKIEELRQRLEADPKSRLFYQLAEELRRASEFAEAERVLRTGLGVYPAYLAAWVSLGRVLREQKKEADAVEALKKALQLDPSNVVAARLMADAYLVLGQKNEALKKYKLVHALMPADDALRSVIDQLEGDVDGRRPAGAAASQVAPSDEAISTAQAGTEDFASPAGSGVEPGDGAGQQRQIASEAEPLFEVAGSGEPEPFVSDAEDLFASREPEDHPSSAAFEEGVADAADQFPGSDAVSERAGEWLGDTPVDDGRLEEPFEHAAHAVEEKAQVFEETADREPMYTAHDESPFEEPVGSFTAHSLEIESPPGIHVDPAPLAADIAVPVDGGMPTEAGPLPGNGEAPIEDVAHTLTMAELYERQGLVDEAREIYEEILTREPDNAEARARLASGRGDPRVLRLTRWLSKISGKEVGRV